MGTCSLEGSVGGFGSPVYIAFDVVALVCALSDVRLLYKRGVAGRQRILRHLWRMFIPLFMSSAYVDSLVFLRASETLS